MILCNNCLIYDLWQSRDFAISIFTGTYILADFIKSKICRLMYKKWQKGQRQTKRQRRPLSISFNNIGIKYVRDLVIRSSILGHFLTRMPRYFKIINSSTYFSFSDSLVDGLRVWWHSVKKSWPHVTRLTSILVCQRWWE